jgi:SAM-dependent methyltransferase
MKASERKDLWANGVSYEGYIGRWSRLVAREFLRWLAVPPQSCWLDVGCGTGALSQTILEISPPRSVLGVDPSEGFLALAREQIQDARAQFLLGDATSLPVSEAVFDVAVSGLVLNFVPQPDQAIREMIRAVRTNGSVTAYLWDYAGQMQLLRFFWDTAATLDPAARLLDEGVRFPLCQPEPLRRLFQDAGLGKVEVRSIDVPTVFRDFDDYWSPFLGGQGPAPGYVRSLTEERRAVLRDHLRAVLPIEASGSIRLTARAWAVRGVRRDE